jgi:hypothetical protein
MSSGVNEMEYYDQTFSRVRGLGLWCLTPLSTIFQLYRDSQLHWWRKPAYPEKTTDLLQIADQLYHISSTPRNWRIRTHNFRGDRN